MMKTFVVIQGHSNYCDFFIDLYKDVENVIWATDTTAPPENLNKIEASTITLVQYAPRPTGFGNINAQVGTTMAGLNTALEMGATHCIKIRSDLYFSDTNKFIDNMIDDGRIYHLAYVSCVQNNTPNLKYKIDNWAKNFPVKNISNYNYITDFINYGPINEMILFWNYPFENPPLVIPAEYKLNFRYLQLKDYDIDMSFEYLSNVFGFFMTQLNNLNIELISLKRKQEMSVGYNYAELYKSTDVHFLG